jgi:hypothetical protein
MVCDPHSLRTVREPSKPPRAYARALPTAPSVVTAQLFTRAASDTELPSPSLRYKYLWNKDTTCLYCDEA